jgi:hypothetical protein
MDRALKRYGTLVLGLVLLLLPACGRQAADTAENRLQAAREHQQVSPLKTTLDNAIKDLSRQFPPDKREDFVQFMRMNIGVEAVEQKAIRVMADHFTVQEIQALTRFYGSPEGRSINEKYGQYLADIMPVIQAQLSQAGSAWLAGQQPQQGQPEPQPGLPDQRQEPGSELPRP